MKYLYATAIVLTAAIFLSACEPESPLDETYTVQVIDGDEVLVGKETRLMWQSYDPDNVITYLKQITSDKADQYCADLEWAGFLDWRLPTIDELRAMVEGYPDLEPGGRCKVTEKCLEYPCKDKGAKEDNDHPCAHDENKATGPGPAGCYWETVWRDKFCGPHWSTSPVENGTGERWVLNFYDPAIFIVVENAGTAFPRCVRK